jgi:hypothetical protein
MRPVICLLFSCLVVQPARAQSLPARQTANPIDYAVAHLERVAGAVRIDVPVRLDGVLDEPVWARAKPATDFIQWEPWPGQPATERTKARFLYDSRNLYVGVSCYDSHSEGIIVNELKEDFAGQEGDGFSLFLDTLADIGATRLRVGCSSGL